MTPRFVVWAGPLKSLRSVTLRKPLLVEICIIRQFLEALRYRKIECSTDRHGPATKVDLSIGNGEVDSSILSGSTILKSMT
jgi:hypothetical protein